jgi:hypothetical protein
MAKFTARVELHAASDEDYEVLHDAMETAGFSKTISADDGTYQLPTAEYNRVADLTRDAVLQDAKSAASSTGRQYSILVTEGSRTWWNLRKVTAGR